ncbi:hypothetical protein DL89DRAFT_65698 [Linderina pennispora]|uniref:Uncharacterized protein n=1 Tax=Linderina pennispora TaxID=61395 RepID=A0A1Y1W0I3_9FUNG|nr:uncharacterized protein DL89DRAFT_65698 [Linderina pennispora]ORX66624.1 hypothetical protein DL89DRAFT_65698 [Linderina pennispora]
MSAGRNDIYLQGYYRFLLAPSGLGDAPVLDIDIDVAGGVARAAPDELGGVARGLAGRRLAQQADDGSLRVAGADRVDLLLESAVGGARGHGGVYLVEK